MSAAPAGMTRCRRGRDRQEGTHTHTHTHKQTHTHVGRQADKQRQADRQADRKPGATQQRHIIITNPITITHQQHLHLITTASTPCPSLSLTLSLSFALSLALSPVIRTTNQEAETCRVVGAGASWMRAAGLFSQPTQAHHDPVCCRILHPLQSPGPRPHFCYFPLEHRPGIESCARARGVPGRHLPRRSLSKRQFRRLSHDLLHQPHPAPPRPPRTSVNAWRRLLVCPRLLAPPYRACIPLYVPASQLGSTCRDAPRAPPFVVARTRGHKAPSCRQEYLPRCPLQSDLARSHKQKPQTPINTQKTTQAVPRIAPNP